MAGQAGTPPGAVTSDGEGVGDARIGGVRSLDFYQALRRLECEHRAQPRLGEAARVTEEPLRLGQRAHVAFEAAQIVAIHERGPEEAKRVEVSFFGAFGPHGPLPLHLSEYALQRIRHGRDSSLTGFVDIFHHRLLTFLYRAWANAQPTVQFDRPERDRFSRYVGSLVGQGTRPASARDTDLDRFCLFMAGHFAAQTRHPEGLSKVLSSYFEVPVAIEEFVGAWLRLPDEYCWRINSRPQGAGQPLGVLGVSTRVGRRVWDRQGKFRVVLGPLSRAQYERLLPGGADLPRLKALVKRYAGFEQAWDVRLIMREPDMQPTRLGKGARVGRSAYLVRETVSPTKRWQDFVFDPLAQAG